MSKTGQHSKSPYFGELSESSQFPNPLALESEAENLSRVKVASSFADKVTYSFTRTTKMTQSQKVDGWFSLCWQSKWWS